MRMPKSECRKNAECSNDEGRLTAPALWYIRHSGSFGIRIFDIRHCILWLCESRVRSGRERSNWRLKKIAEAGELGRCLAVASLMTGTLVVPVNQPPSSRKFHER